MSSTSLGNESGDSEFNCAFGVVGILIMVFVGLGGGARGGDGGSCRLRDIGSCWAVDMEAYFLVSGLGGGGLGGRGGDGGSILETSTGAILDIRIYNSVNVELLASAR